MSYIDNIIFLLCISVGFGLFFRSLRIIYRNIMLGKTIHRSDNKAERWKIMAKVALGQSKMTRRPVAGILHILVYAGFIIINLELAEILVDGLFGTHRVLSSLLSSSFYNLFTSTLEVFSFLVLLSVIIFFIRRNILKVSRLSMQELKGWAKDDANYILLIECSLMLAFLSMNSADALLQHRGSPHYPILGAFPVSEITFLPIFKALNLSETTLIFIERIGWWYHILGILFFMNYLYYSKHLHILLAFPNAWFSKLQPKAELSNLPSVTKEIKLMMNPNADPYAASSDSSEIPVERFGANDIFDLNRVQLLNAYSCTECGRCTAVCPASMTGKSLSPRKIMMKTRDRLEEVGQNINKNGQFQDDGKRLLYDFISKEEILACTTCNACTEACPILIDPLSIIIDLRRYMVMEEASAPQEWNLMMTNIENNAAPWQYNQADRLNWADEEN